jgi:hypothetical protein
MGLFSKKPQAPPQFGLGGGVQGQMAYAQLAQKLHHQGIQATGVVSAVRPTGQTDFGGSPEIDFDVTITKPTGESYATTIRQGMNAAQVGDIQPGKSVTVKYDPDNPASAMIYGW